MKLVILRLRLCSFFTRGLSLPSPLLFFPELDRQGSIGEVSIVRKKSTNGSIHGSAHGSQRTSHSKQLSFTSSPIELEDVAVGDRRDREAGGGGEGGVGGGQCSLPSPRLEPPSGTVSEAYTYHLSPSWYLPCLSRNMTRLGSAHGMFHVLKRSRCSLASVVVGVRFQAIYVYV